MFKGQRVRRIGLPDCEGCAVRLAVDSLDEDNYAALELYLQYLEDAYREAFAMTEERVVVMDHAALRLALEAERIPTEMWPMAIRKMAIIHKARWGT